MKLNDFEIVKWIKSNIIESLIILVLVIASFNIIGPVLTIGYILYTAILLEINSRENKVLLSFMKKNYITGIISSLFIVLLFSWNWIACIVIITLMEYCLGHPWIEKQIADIMDIR